MEPGTEYVFCVSWAHENEADDSVMWASKEVEGKSKLTLLYDTIISDN